MKLIVNNECHTGPHAVANQDETLNSQVLEEGMKQGLVFVQAKAVGRKTAFR